MHNNPLAFAAALCLAAFLPQYAQASPEHDALVYLDAQVLPKKAVACSSRLAGYTARFEPAFRTWLARNKDNVASGEAFMRAEAERTKVAFEPDIQALRTANVLTVFAAGNAGPGAGTSVSPANNPGAIAAGAVDAGDVVAAFSSRGPSACGGGPFPTVTAPGAAGHHGRLRREPHAAPRGDVRR